MVVGFSVVSVSFWVTERSEQLQNTILHICEFKTDKTISGGGRNDKRFHVSNFI